MTIIIKISYFSRRVIVSTDAKLKKDKYEHIGMKHVNTRTLGKKSFIYDLVKEA